MRSSSLSRLKALGFSSYENYLASPQWRQNRTRCISSETCFICGKRGIVHFHHCSYENIGDEQPGDLVVLCGEHHRAVHKIARMGGSSLKTAHLDLRHLIDTGETPAKRKKREKKSSRTSQRTREQEFIRNEKKALRRKPKKRKQDFVKESEFVATRYCSCAMRESVEGRLRGSCFKCGKPKTPRSRTSPAGAPGDSSGSTRP